MFTFDTHSFYTKGYTAGFLPEEISQQCKELIKNTEWADIDFHVKYPEWCLLHTDSDADDYYEEKMRELKGLNASPPEVKYIGEQILALPYFDNLKNRLVKTQHSKINWMRTFVPNSYGLWNNQTNLPWHSDINDGAHITILAYFTDEEWDKEWKGQIKIGVEDEFGNINEVYEHYPIDSTFIVINNMNPFFHHSVIQNNLDHNRYTLSFRYCIQ
jgi:hypothetical protein